MLLLLGSSGSELVLRIASVVRLGIDCERIRTDTVLGSDFSDRSRICDFKVGNLEK
ncbi:hypothetical protein Tsubulata_005314 [Turnera subulata]|uniref:Uncharacterized protein n=1 Tax=Turnera subulata TaxID=218843 RepID=A0A9Q0F1I1_9ROSI|nr:hypothetical protein Tsubulata_005314 [Turnera subulata]